VEEKRRCRPGTRFRKKEKYKERHHPDEVALWRETKEKEKTRLTKFRPPPKKKKKDLLPVAGHTKEKLGRKKKERVSRLSRREGGGKRNNVVMEKIYRNGRGGGGKEVRPRSVIASTYCGPSTWQDDQNEGEGSPFSKKGKREKKGGPSLAPKGKKLGMDFIPVPVQAKKKRRSSSDRRGVGGKKEERDLYAWCAKEREIRRRFFTGKEGKRRHRRLSRFKEKEGQREASVPPR